MPPVDFRCTTPPVETLAQRVNLEESWWNCWASFPALQTLTCRLSLKLVSWGGIRALSFRNTRYGYFECTSKREYKLPHKVSNVFSWLSVARRWRLGTSCLHLLRLHIQRCLHSLRRKTSFGKRDTTKAAACPCDLQGSSCRIDCHKFVPHTSTVLLRIRIIAFASSAIIWGFWSPSEEPSPIVLLLRFCQLWSKPSTVLRKTHSAFPSTTLLHPTLLQCRSHKMVATKIEYHTSW